MAWPKIGMPPLRHQNYTLGSGSQNIERKIFCHKKYDKITPFDVRHLEKNNKISMEITLNQYCGTRFRTFVDPDPDRCKIEEIN